MADDPPLPRRPQPPDLGWLPQLEEVPQRRPVNAALFHAIIDVPPPLAPNMPAPEASLEIQRRLVELQDSVLRLELEASANVQQIGELKAEQKSIRELAFLQSRVHPTSFHALKTNKELREQLLGPPLEAGKVPPARKSAMWVMSVDIRRSTELMLKARTPEAFADFITTLCSALMNCVQSAGGIVDKFTGDGILAFFPDFFSGPDAGYLAVSTAVDCHAQFKEHYRSHWSSFQMVRLDVGLGIGIDYGPCTLVNVNDGITVVGTPVVHACRLGGAPAGKTYLNRPAYEALQANCPGAFRLTETTIDIKHEGLTLAYDTTMGDVPYGPTAPEWFSRPSGD